MPAHRAGEFKGTCWSQMTCGSIVALSHHPHIQRGTHNQFTVPKHIKHSKGMGLGPWKLNIKLKIFPKQIKREITVINHSLSLSNAFSLDLKFKLITSHSPRFKGQGRIWERQQSASQLSFVTDPSASLSQQLLPFPKSFLLAKAEYIYTSTFLTEPTSDCQPRSWKVAFENAFVAQQMYF